MRIAILSDIHGNLTAFEAVLRDLSETSPDLILHGGDLADSGARPAEIVDRIRDLGWQGVLGNTDEMHSRPQSLEEFVSESAAPSSLWAAIREMAAATHAMLGADRIEWLRRLPRVLTHGDLALLHASPESAWKAPDLEAADSELKSVYAALAQPIVVYGHIHRPFVRCVLTTRGTEMLVANTGSVGLSYDGDPRASYLLVDESKPKVCRVEYDIEKEIKAHFSSGLPHSNWVARMLRAAAPQMP